MSDEVQSESTYESDNELVIENEQWASEEEEEEEDENENLDMEETDENIADEGDGEEPGAGDDCEFSADESEEEAANLRQIEEEESKISKDFIVPDPPRATGSTTSGSSTSKKKSAGRKKKQTHTTDQQWPLHFPSKLDESGEEFGRRLEREQQLIDEKLGYNPNDPMTSERMAMRFSVLNQMNEKREAAGLPPYIKENGRFLSSNESSATRSTSRNNSITSSSESKDTRSTSATVYEDIPPGNEFTVYSSLQQRVVDAMAKLKGWRDSDTNRKYNKESVLLILRQTEEWFGMRRAINETNQYTPIEHDAIIYSRFMSNATDQGKIMDDIKETSVKWRSVIDYLSVMVNDSELIDICGDRLRRLKNKMERMFLRIAETSLETIGMNNIKPGTLGVQDASEIAKQVSRILNITSNTVNKNTGAVEYSFDADSKQIKKNATAYILEAMGAEAQKLGYRRHGWYLQRECVWPENSVDRPIIFSQYKVNAYEPIKDMSEFLYEITRRDRNAFLYSQRLTSRGVVQHVLDEFALNDEAEVQKLQRCRHQFAFTNVYYDVLTDYMSPHDQRDAKPLPTVRVGERQDEEKVLAAAKFIRYPLTDTDPCGPHYAIHNGIYYDLDGKQIYNANTGEGKMPIRTFMDINTPCAEKIFSDQGWEPLVKMWMYFMLGRLMFNVGVKFGGDGLQIIALLYGKAGTGKSTIVKAMCNMYHGTDVFNMESTGETTFALQSSIGKWMWVIMELKADLNLSSSRYQQMVSGERMPIPIKGKENQEVDWILPGIVVGNDKLPFSDAQGSVSRRTLMFEYKRQLLKVKTNLDAELSAELPNLIRKCGRARHFILEWLGDRDIWAEGVLPDYFKQTKEHLKAETDPVTRYFNTYCIIDQEQQENEHYFTPLLVLTNAIKSSGGKERVKTQSTQHINEEYVKGELAKMKLKMFQIGNQKHAVAKRVLKPEQKTETAELELLALANLNKHQERAGIITEPTIVEDIEPAVKPLPQVLSNTEQLHTVFNIRQAKDFSDNGIEVIVKDRNDIASIEYNGESYSSGIFVTGLVIRKIFDDATKRLVEPTCAIKHGEEKQAISSSIVSPRRNENPFA